MFNASEDSTVETSDSIKCIKRKNVRISDTLKKKQLKLLEQKLEQHEKNTNIGESVLERNKAITVYMSTNTRAALMGQFRTLRQDIIAAEKEKDSENNREYVAILKAEFNNVKRHLDLL